MANNPEVEVTFKAFNQEFNKSLNEMNKTTATLRQELKLEQTQLKLNGTEQQKLESVMNSLSQQYEVAQNKTAATSAALDRAKQLFGENSTEVKKMETQLRRAQIAEQELANKLEVTSNSLAEVTAAEAERTSEAGKAKVKLTELEAAQGDLAQSSDTLKRKYEAEKVALGQGASETEKAKLEYDYLKEAKRAAADETENLKRQLDNAKQAFGNNSREVSQLEGALHDATRAEQEIIDRTREVERVVGDSFRVAGSEIREFGERAEEAGRQLGEVGEGLTTKVTAPLVGFAALATVAATQFETSQAQIQASLGVTGEEAEALKVTTQNVWKEGFGESLEEVTDALVRVKQNMKGVSGDAEIQKITKDALALAKTFDSDVNEVTRAGNNLMKNFGIESEEAFDMMAKGAQNGLNFSNEMFDNLAEYAPLWADMGFSAEEMFGILESGADNGVYNLDYLNDVMKEFQIRMLDGSTTTSDAMEGMTAETQDLWKSFIVGEATVADMSQQIAADLLTLDDQVERNALGTAVFGTKWEDLGGDVVMAMLTAGEGLEGFEGAMDGMTEVQEQTFGQKWTSLVRGAQLALEPLGMVLIDMASIILPAISSAMATVSNLFAGLDPIGQKIVTVIGIIVGAMGPLILVISQLVIWFSSIARYVGNLVSSFGSAAGGASRFGRALTVARTILTALTGPIGIIIGIITVLVTLFVNLYKNNEDFRIKVQEIWTSITTAIGLAIETIKVFIMDVFGQVVTWWNENQESIRAAVENVWSWIQSFLQIAFDVILALFKVVWPVIEMLIVTTWTAIKNVIQGAINVIMGIINFFVALFTGDWKGLWEAVKQILNGAIQLIWGIIDLYFIGKIMGVARTFATAFRSTFTTVWTAIKGVFTSSVNFVKDGVTTGFNAMKTIVTTIMNAFKTPISTTWNTIKTTVTTLIDSMKTAITTKFEAIKTSVTTIFDAVKTAITNPVETAKKTVETAVNAIKGFFSGMKLSIPSITLPTLPKPKISGSFSLSPPSVPKISWNAKGGVFNRPTIFNTANAGFQGVGEAGPEAILPLSEKVLGSIGRMIAMTMPKGDQNIVIQGGDVYIDGRMAGNIMWKVVKENIDQNENRMNQFKG